MKTKSQTKALDLSLLFLAGAVAVHAAQFGDFTYQSSGTEITITKYTGAGGAVTIPDTIAGLPVTTIGFQAFVGCTNLTSVVILDSVARIELLAFMNCTRLTGACFEGRPPEVESSDLGNCPLIVFYRPGTSGWGPTFAGHPTALWIDPPVYSDWLPSSGLLTQYPDATAQADEPDEDGLSNYAEMLAGTDPTDDASVLTLENMPRPAHLIEADRTPLAASQKADRMNPSDRFGEKLRMKPGCAPARSPSGGYDRDWMW